MSETINGRLVLLSRDLQDGFRVVLCKAPSNRFHRYAVWTVGAFAFSGGYYHEESAAFADYWGRK